MDKQSILKLAKLLLDLGKRNPLVNFRDRTSSTLEFISPKYEIIYDRLADGASFEVFDPKTDRDSDGSEEYGGNETSGEILKKEDVLQLAPKLKKNQLLPFSAAKSPMRPLKAIRKKAMTVIQETGVNIAYLAFGFIHWKEREDSAVNFKAPILLLPVEIQNDSSLEPFYISAREDEAVVNPTFAYKLENEYNFQLPEFDGEDIVHYFDEIESLIVKLGWSLSREVKLGTFSFLKINMYRDLLNHADTISQNTNIRRILDPNSGSQSDNEEGESHPAIQNPMNFHTVVDADSSQLEAIALAKSGASFVLQGPPGTGKSQTITNIIAECLASGKKVLFVSEKLAALEVVYDKLTEAGLSDFCLQLHSHKANKKDVIAELARTLKLEKNGVSSVADRELETLQRTQTQLENYERELHQKRDVIDMSLYMLFEKFAHFRKYPDVHVLIPDIKSKGESYLSDAVELLSGYARHSVTIGYQYKNNPWYGYIGLDNSYQADLAFRQNFSATCSALKLFEKKAEKIYQICKIDCSSLASLKDNAKQGVTSLLRILGESDFLTPSLLNRRTLDNLLKNVSRMQNLSADILRYRQDVDAEFDQDVYQIDGKSAYNALKKFYSGWFQRLFSKKYKEIQDKFRVCRKNGKKFDYKSLLSAAQKLMQVQGLKQEYGECECVVKDPLGVTYHGYSSNWEHIIQQLNGCLACSCLNEVGRVVLVYQPDEFIALKQELIDLCDDLDSLFEKNEPVFAYLNGCFDGNIFDFFSSSFCEAQKKLEGCLKEADRRNNWIIFWKHMQKIQSFGLTGFVDSCIQNNFAADDMPDIFQKMFYRQWIDHVIGSSDVLTEFNRTTQDQNISCFAQKDLLQFEINKAKIRAAVSAKRPDLGYVAGGGAIAVLLREAGKKRKQKPIRVLLSEIGELAQVLKPCFMMSPLSVSTFLDSKELNFDTVVFDEASQIFPQDAVGAIYRGKQLIVVGDSKQMPPSNFFNSMTSSDDYDDEEEAEAEGVSDFESILDLCSTSMPQIWLKWHYRSRCEELIAFSNRNFYKGDLISFPSAHTKKEGYGVSFHYVNGIFDRKTKTNRAEADYIVDLIYDHFEKYPNRSLGVVAFSASQQDLIESCLSKRRAADSSKEEFFRSDLPEPFFIKNLETVQGDERDTIIFSIAYARDSMGRFMANFGPVNREGGERRLNVAVTRAKYNVEVVCSVHAYDIDLKVSHSKGAQLLREYIDYAENGMVALERAPEVRQFETFDSDFEMEVYDCLTEAGFSVDTQVGCSKFRIDLALKIPQTSDYVLAIECDGATYHSAATVRDRDRLRQQILENMGWHFYRIWSTDWFRNNRIERERLVKTAKEAVESRERALLQEGEKTTPAVPVKNPDQAEAPTFVQEIHEEKNALPHYETVGLEEAQRNGGGTYLGMVAYMLGKEAPLSEEWLLKRTVNLFGRSKVTDFVRNEYRYKMAACKKYGIVRKDGFLYTPGSEKQMLRVPAESGNAQREIKYISLEELANGMLFLIEQNVSVPKDGLYKEIVSLLGFSRMGEMIEARLDQALRLIADRVEFDGELFILRDKV